MITDSELDCLILTAGEIAYRRYQMKLSGNPSYVEQCKNLSDDLAEDLCDQIERLYFKIQHRREKNET